jgi:hypothetical protein
MVKIGYRRGLKVKQEDWHGELAGQSINRYHETDHQEDGRDSNAGVGIYRHAQK